MNIKLTTIGNNARHLTQYERNAITNLGENFSFEKVDLLYDETLYDVNDKFYVLLGIQTKENHKVVATCEGASQFEAFQEAVKVCKSRLLNKSQLERLIVIDNEMYKVAV